MKWLQYIGIFFVLTGLGLFCNSLLVGQYRLKPAQVAHEFPQNMSNGKTFAENAGKELSEMYATTYSSSFAFVAAWNKAVDTYNAPWKEKGDWGMFVGDPKTFYVTKHAYTGLLSDRGNLKIFLFICFMLTSLGAALYYVPQFAGKPAGIHNNGIFKNKATNKGWVGIIAGTFLILFYFFLYFTPQYITPWVIMVDPVSNLLTGGEASQWFLYGFMYTTAMLVMGLRMLLKYKGNRYQQWRTLSVMGFQTVFAFLLPNLLSELHGMDLKNIWPLDYSYFDTYKIKAHLGADAPQSATAVYLWGIGLFLVGVPVFTYFFGKRWYCSWVCGCGGLAETLGDPYRQLSSKKLVAWKIERILIHSVLVFATVMTLLLILAYNGIVEEGMAGYIKYIYGIFIGSVFSGVVGTGFYPLMGNRVWCRFGCPLAAYLGLWQKKKSKFRITTNGGQCISCGNCSTYCEMGIDVRAYAQRGQNIVRSSCVGCGVCSAVCPRGVLKLENGPDVKRVEDNPIIIGRKDEPVTLHHH